MNNLAKADVSTADKLKAAKNAVQGVRDVSIKAYDKSVELLAKKADDLKNDLNIAIDVLDGLEKTYAALKAGLTYFLKDACGNERQWVKREIAQLEKDIQDTKFAKDLLDVLNLKEETKKLLSGAGVKLINKTLDSVIEALEKAHEATKERSADLIPTVMDDDIDPLNADAQAAEDGPPEEPNLSELLREIETLEVAAETYNGVEQSIIEEYERKKPILAEGQAEIRGGVALAYFSVSDGDEIIFRGRTDTQGQLEVFLPPNTDLLLSIFDLENFAVGEVAFRSGPSGSPTRIPNLLFRDIGSDLDSDNDLLPDKIERIIGTSPSLRDTDADGISDLAEVERGQDPLGGFALPTGLIASMVLRGAALDMAVGSDAQGTGSMVAFLALGEAGFAVVSLDNPLAPQQLALVGLSGTAQSVAFDSALRLAVVATNASIAVVDVQQVAAPVILWEIAVNAAQVEARDGIAYALVGNALHTYDLLTGSLIETIALPAQAIGLALDHSHVYVQDAAGLLRIFETVGDALVARGSTSVPPGVPSHILSKLFVADGIVYLPVDQGFNGGYATIDARDPNAPIALSGPDDVAIVGDAIALTGSGRGVVVGNLGTNALDVVNTSDPSNTGAFITRINLPSNPNDVAIVNGFAYVATDTGLQVVNFLPRDVNGVAPVVTLDTAGLDVDANTPGIQLLEGTTLSLAATITDDVLVSAVEVLVNGIPTSADPTYPFDLRAFVPTIAASDATTATLQVRATDTGGNFGLSDLVTVDLVPDTISPTITEANVEEGATVGRSFRSFRFTFSEPVFLTGPVSEVFRLIGPDGTPMPGAVAAFREGGRSAQVTVDFLPSGGGYRLEVDAARIRDGAGNALGSGTLLTNFVVGDYDEGAFGTTGDDDLSTGDGYDSVSGGPQADPESDIGNDTLISGAGEDTLVGYDGNDSIDGGADADSVEGGAGDDTLRGGGGNDSLSAGGGTDQLYGEDGDDVLDLGAGAGHAQGDAGNDTLLAEVASDVAGLNLYGGGGNDSLALEGSATDGFPSWYGYRQLHGDDGDDTLSGSAGGERLWGGAGNDDLAGNDGDDDLRGGGRGLDLLEGGEGNDTLDDEDAAGLDNLFVNAANGHLYRYVPGNVPWQAARDAAAASSAGGWQGYLATITTEEEQAFVTAAIGSPGITWIGGSDAAEEGSWAWVAGPEAGTVFHIEGADPQPGFSWWDAVYQPDGGEAEDHLALWSYWTTNGWHDRAEGSAVSGYLIEYGGLPGDGVLGVLAGDTLLGGEGDDGIVSRGGNDVVEGGAGDDLLTLRLDYALRGDAFSLADPDAVAVLANGGAISGIERLDLYGSGFADSVEGGAGDDTLRGGGGNDSLSAGGGTDQLYGEDGDDVLDLGAGAGHAQGDAGNDTLLAEVASDVAGLNLYGGGGNDSLALEGSATDGFPSWYGYRQLHGDDGDDTLSGSAGGERLWGGAGNDDLAGNDGDDELFGGEGSDVFVFGPSDGADRVIDFEVSVDAVRLVGFGPTLDSFADILARSSQSGANTLLVATTGESITLVNIDRESLSSENFLFA